MMMKICCNIIKTTNKAKDDGHNESMQCLIFMLIFPLICHWSVCFISTWASDLMLALRALSGKQSEVLCELIGWNAFRVSDFLLSWKLTQKPDKNQMEADGLHPFQRQFYVWDNVAIALHMDHGQVPAPPTPPSIETPEAFYKKLLPINLVKIKTKCWSFSPCFSARFHFQVLKFDCDRLRANLTYCEKPEEDVLTKLSLGEKPEQSAAPGIQYDSFENAKSLVGHLWPDAGFPLGKEPSLSLVF